MKWAIVFGTLLFLGSALSNRALPQQMLVTNALPSIPADAPPVSAESGEPAPSPTPKIPSVSTTVRVDAEDSSLPTALAPVPLISRDQILSSAGTYADFSRYLQVLPGVVWSSDLSNDILVRGGHPLENLFVIDGVEFPAINHFSLSGTSGGFTSMIDSTAIGNMDLRSGAYDVTHSSRLSSLIDIRTRQLGEARRAGNISVGIAGLGGLYQQALPGKGSLLLSAHRSILNLVTNDIGINGVPIYSNGLARLEVNPSTRDNLTLLSLSGADSITMTPCPSDQAVTSIDQTQYAGWRTSGALTWRHAWSPHVVANLIASYSVTRQQIAQQQQVGFEIVNGRNTCQPASLLPVYTEDSRNGLPLVNYAVHADFRGWLLTAGASAGLAMPNVDVAQPTGELSPFSAIPNRSDAVTFRRKFSTGQSAVFAQADGGMGARLRFMAGLRAETFAVTGDYTLDPRLSAVFRLNRKQTLNGSWNLSHQLPPMMDLLSYPGNRSLSPIQANQLAFGLRVWQAGWGALDLQAYSKRYRREPVSTEYPQLMLFNMVDTLGQAFVWLPLTSAGNARSRGLELLLRAHWQDRAELLVSATRSQSTYAALDDIRRPGNYDVPVQFNSLINLRFPFGIKLDSRESLSSGRVYTPFDDAESMQQSRGIYDLARINALRGPLYNRLDVELERRFRVSGGAIEIHVGAENVLNRGNLLGYVWLDNCPQGAACNVNGVPVEKVDQIGRYPVLSARYQF
jgi:hypothetical protein